MVDLQELVYDLQIVLSHWKQLSHKDAKISQNKTESEVLQISQNTICSE